MGKNNKNIKDFDPTNVALFLINQHTIGDIRDENDLNNIKYHSAQTINFMIELLENVDGDLNEKIDFIKKTKSEISKFKGN